jgi:hypothetical protein
MFVGAISLLAVGLLTVVFHLQSSPLSSFGKSVPTVGSADVHADRYASFLSKLEHLRNEKNLPADVYSRLRGEYVIELKRALEKLQTEG